MKSVKITLEEFLYDSTNPVTLSSSFNPFVQTIYLHGGTRIATFKRWNIFFIPLTKIYYQFSRESIQLGKSSTFVELTIKPISLFLSLSLSQTNEILRIPSLPQPF